MLKILITGPECSGKTSLTIALARHYKVPLVPELARAYLTVRTMNYDRQDLVEIAENQLALEDSCDALPAPFVFIDTSMLVLKIWSEYKYGGVNDLIEQSFQERIYDLCFLCQPVEPYVPESLRENPNDRWSLYYLYLKELWLNKRNHRILEGTLEQRFESVVSLISQIE